MRVRVAAAVAGVTALYAAVFWFGHGLAEDGFFHRYFDQVSYRYEAAKVAHALTHDGFAAGIATAWDRTTAQGITYPLLGGLCYAAGIDPVHGTFAVFLVCLLVIGRAMSSVGRQLWVGWLAVAAVTATSTLLNRTGGPIDFRPDFLGQTLWTTAAALAHASVTFSRTRTCVALGVVLGLAFCTRSLALAYAAAALPWLLVAAWIGVDRDTGRRQRLRNLGLIALIAGAIAAPLFVGHFERMWEYYIDNHISQRENEARGFGGTFAENLPKYVRSLRKHHVGWAAAVVMALGLGLTLRYRRPESPRWWPQLLVAAGFAMPLVVMAAGPQFSSTVSGVVAGSLALAALVPGISPGLRPIPRWAWVAITLGMAVWPVRFLYKTTRDHDRRVAAGHHQVPAQHEAILDWTEGRERVVLSTLPLIEAHSLAMLELVGFERSGALPDRLAYGLGHQIYAQDTAEEFERRLTESDVVLWWDGGCSGGELPANLEVIQRRELIERVLSAGFTPSAEAHEITLDGAPLRLYFRSR